MAGNAPTKPAGRKVVLPDYEANLRENARRVLLESGVPPGRLDAEWERLRNTPFPLEPPTDAELDAMAERQDAARDPQAAAE